ncbi:DUF7935 family protein [Croceiramulus getboli]|nr:hypothetical protein P8624_13780 [Flavobacteriaceae bacterium YJPT1-3]
MEERILDFLFAVAPALIVGLIAYYFFKTHTANEEGRRRFLLHKDIQKDTVPMRLQAYERLTLFLERITPAKLIPRVKPSSQDPIAYENSLIKNIENEFEHNIAQQIYVSEECWNVVLSSKNATIRLIRQTNMSDKIDTADKLRETILSNLIEQPAPSSVGLQFVHREVKTLLGK